MFLFSLTTLNLSASASFTTILLFITHCSALLDDLFIVKTGTTKGGCDAQVATLERWLSESQTLVAAGLQAFDDAATGDEVALAHLDAFFGLNRLSSPQEQDEVKTYLSNINHFYLGTLALQNKPRLFCSSDWLQPFKRTDVAFEIKADNSADTVPTRLKRFNAKGKLQGVAIQDVQDYAKFLFNDGDRSSPNKYIPYWSQDLFTYVFETPYAGKPRNSYCGLAGNLAGTNTVIEPRIMTICPTAFVTSQPTKLEFIKPTISDDEANGVVRTYLEDVLPQCVTLFHETFHLVQGMDESKDASYYLSTLQEALEDPDKIPLYDKLDPESDDEEGGEWGPDDDTSEFKDHKTLVRENPETFAYFCVSYWYYLQDVGAPYRYTFTWGWANLVSTTT